MKPLAVVVGLLALGNGYERHEVTSQPVRVTIMDAEGRAVKEVDATARATYWTGVVTTRCADLYRKPLPTGAIRLIAVCVGSGREPKTRLWFCDVTDGSVETGKPLGVRVVADEGLRGPALKGAMMLAQGQVIRPGRMQTGAGNGVWIIGR